MRRLVLLAVVAVGCVPVGDELPTYPEQPRQAEALALILDAYELGRPPLAIDWGPTWDTCAPPEFTYRGRCVASAIDPGPVFRMRPALTGRFSDTPLLFELCRHFVRRCSLEVTDRALNALLHAGL